MLDESPLKADIFRESQKYGEAKACTAAGTHVLKERAEHQKTDLCKYVSFRLCQRADIPWRSYALIP
jgi:hypothetical protein